MHVSFLLHLLLRLVAAMTSSLTEKELIDIVISIDKKQKLLKETVITHVKEKLEIESMSDEHKDIIASTLRKYRKWKAEYHKKYGYNHIAGLASTEILLEIETSMSSFEEQPSSKKSKNETTVQHRRPSLPFYQVGDKRKKERTQPLLDLIEKERETNFPELSLNQLLGYLIFRTNRQSEKNIASIGLKLFEKTFTENNEFNTDEAITLKHNLTLSREQIRKVRHTLTNKGIHFPTINELLEGRKKLRLLVKNTLGGKGVKVSFHELVKMTTQSVLNIVTKEAAFEPKENDQYTMHFKDGGDGAGQQSKLKSKKAVNSKQNMFQYGLTPLKLICTRNTGVKEIMWENHSPNSAMAVRPIYLIRESETDPELLEEVIKTTDQAREKLNNETLVLELNSKKVDMHFYIQDTMKDLKFKRNISGLKGAKCILCNTKAEDWTSIEKVMDGFPITHSAEESLQIYFNLVDDNGNIPRTRDDFHIRKGLTAKPITSSDQHSMGLEDNIT